MKHLKVKDDDIVCYLLGGMSETEQLAMEEAFVSDPQIFTLVADIENDLIDDYVRGRLALQQRELFERNFLTSHGQRRRVEIAKALLPSLGRIETIGADHSAIIENPVRGQRFFSFSFKPQLAIRLAATLAVMLFATSVAWLLLENRHLRQELRIAQEDAARRESVLGQQVTDERRKNSQMANEIAQLRGNSAAQTTPPPLQTAPTFVTLLLSATVNRDPVSGDIPHLTIPPDAEQVQLVLKMEDSGYPDYRAEILTASGVGILTRVNLKPSLRRSIATFTVNVPSNMLADGVYTLTLRGISKNGEGDILSNSSFRIEKP